VFGVRESGETETYMSESAVSGSSIESSAVERVDSASPAVMKRASAARSAMRGGIRTHLGGFCEESHESSTV